MKIQLSDLSKYLKLFRLIKRYYWLENSIISTNSNKFQSRKSTKKFPKKY